ncbi:glycosyltransferase family 2 protein [Chryseobacterium mulctrae]|uniref:glycosyltransferase family 2 protein n=1 Tax=Chryseobacterium mulctrae TaxID=2576777 RepID=UPI0011165130|nr:glycosyltransferase family 2 protein [Chryseobacterium mulctrae]
MNPLISIIVPIYKVEKYLEKCVESLLSQEYSNIEIFLVNDGSPDNCGSICNHFAQIDNRVIVIHKENGGLSDARNAALSLVKGEYITFIDSDDFVESTYISNLFNLIHKYQSDIAVSLFKFVIEGERQIVYQEEGKDMKFSRLEALNTMFYQDTFDNNATAKLYHSALFKNIRFPKGLLYEDLLTTYKLMLLAERGVAFSDVKTYNYLLREDSIEGSPFSDKKMKSLIFAIEDFEKIKLEMPDLEKSINCRILSLSLHLLFETEKYSNDERVIFLIVKKYRFKVLKDQKARRKARIAAIISYFGLESLRFLYKFGKSRNHS